MLPIQVTRPGSELVSKWSGGFFGTKKKLIFGAEGQRTQTQTQRPPTATSLILAKIARNGGAAGEECASRRRKSEERGEEGVWHVTCDSRKESKHEKGCNAIIIPFETISVCVSLSRLLEKNPRHREDEWWNQRLSQVVTGRWQVVGRS